MMENIFEKEGADRMIARINGLTTDTKGKWGKMSVDQMLAHCNVAYELVYTTKHPRPNAMTKFFIRLFAKQAVVGPKPYPKNSRTAPMFVVEEERDFEVEKKRIVDHIVKTYELGIAHFDGKESHAFGNLSIKEWNTLFSKHLDHHLTQFGV